jgi:hypothetical protein
MDVHGTRLDATIHARSVCPGVAMSANKVRTVAGLWAGGECKRYARSLTPRWLVYLALAVGSYPLSASGGIFGEGYSSPAPGAPAGISFRAFTIYTGQEACAKSAVPSELKVLPNPIMLKVGERIHRTNASARRRELIVEAYGANGQFLPTVPIIVSTLDPNGVIANRSDWDHFEAIAEGEAELVVDWACQPAGGTPLRASVRVVVGSSMRQRPAAEPPRR